MAGIEKDYLKNPALNEKEVKLSIIYVRKKIPKIGKKLSYVNNLYDKERIKLFKRNHFQIFTYKNGPLKCFVNKYQESCLSHKKVLSMPELNYLENEYKSSFNRKSCNYFFSKNRTFFKSNFLVYILPKIQYQNPECPFFKNSVLKIYRCQLNTHEESCCCSCNSDAMFEVMKSLYDCYKKKNCDNCNCILCGHLPREERRLGELRKSGVSIPLAKIGEKKRKKSKEKVKRKISSLEGKNVAEKEQILRDVIKSGAPLPEPKTKSDKELIKKVQTELRGPLEVLERGTLLDIKKIPSDKIKQLKADGLLTPLEGKTSEQKEKILTGLAMNGIPLPKGKTESEKKIIDKVRKDVGLPPEPQTSVDKKRYDKAMSKGLITPLLGKSASEKERILKGQADLGLTLPEGRTPSEKKLIDKMKVTKAEPSDLKVPSAKLDKSKAEGVLTPLKGKTPEEKEKIIKDLAMKGLPLPEGKSTSEKKLINKIRTEVGLPPQPKTPSTKEKYAKAQAAGLIVPLEGKTESQKEKILKEQAKLGLSLPEGRSPSEKALIAKVKAETQEPLEIAVPSDKIKTDKAAGLLTPLHGKTPEQKEKILRDLAMQNIPLPEGKTASEKFAIDKVRKDIGLPPEPKSKKEKSKYTQAVAAGLIIPLEGKSQAEKEKILQGQAELGLQLPEGRSPSEKALIKKIKSKKKKHRDKSVEGVLSPDKRKKLDDKTRKVLKEGKGPSDECICSLISPESDRVIESKSKATKTKDIKTPSQKEKILRELAKQGSPLPEPKTASEKNILDKVNADLGLPPVPTTPSLKEKYSKAQKAGVIVPLQGKTPSQKEIILRKQAEMGIPLPEGRTPSEKALVNKIRATVKPESIASEKLRKAKEAGLLMPLTGKSPEEQKRILRNIAKAGLPLPEGKTPSEKQIIQKVKDDMGLPSKGIPSEIFRKAKAGGLITPLVDKTPAQKEKILRDRLAVGLPLPEGVTASDKQLIKKIKTSPGYTSPKISSAKLKKAKTAELLKSLEGKTPSQKEKILEQQIAAGLPLPEGKTRSDKEIIKKIQAKRLEGKTASQKEKILRSIAKQGLALPEPKTISEKALIDKVLAKEKASKEMKPLSAKLRLAKAAGLLTPLEGKSPEQKEKILKGLAKAGIPLPEGKTSSEKKLIEKVREEIGLPPEPKTSSMKNKMKQAQLAGIITPLEGKTPTEKEKILKKMQENDIPLPKGRTASEKSLIKKIKADVKSKPHEVPSSKIEKAKVEGILTPLEGKTPAQKEKIIRELVQSGRPLPEGKTRSEKALIKKIKAEKGLGLSPEKIKKLDKKTAKGMKEGKGPSDECICHILSPKIEKERSAGALKNPSEKLRKSKEAGLLTPLQGKSLAEKEKILKGLAMQGIPFPEAKTTSEKKLINKVRADVGLPPEPKTPSVKEKYNKAIAAGLITPLQGKSSVQKEKILRGQVQMGVPLPEGRTPSEKDLIAKVKATTPPLSKVQISPEKALKSKVSLEGKSPEEKEKILRNLAIQGIPLPEAKTSSEKKMMEKIRADVGLPPEPKTKLEKEKYDNAVAARIITPLQGKSPSQKEKILRRQAEMGLNLPKPRTASEKDLIDKIKTTVPTTVREPIEKIRKSKALSRLPSLEGKTSKQKENIIKELVLQGKLPEPKTESEKKLFDKVRAEVGLPPEPTTASIKQKYAKAKNEGLITPLQGKTASQKEKILRGQAKLGIPLPEGRTPSEKTLIKKIKETTPKPSPTAKPISTMPSKKIAMLDTKTAKVMKEGKGPSDECICHILSPKVEKKRSAEALKVPSEKLRKAKEAGLVTPLEGKSSAEKEKILKGLAMQGVPLPEAKTTSEKKLINKIRGDVGLPPEPRTKSTRKLYDKAMAAGYITPLQGKTQSQKEKILRKQAALGLPLPEGRTPSEKDLIARIKQTVPPPEALKHDKSKVAGLLTPLEGKSLDKKEKILRSLAKAGLPLPEGKTPSEKSLIQKVKSEYEKPSKAMVETFSEKKDKSKTKSKKIGVAPERLSGKRVTKTKGAITEEFQDIIKTTTCDRGCGCDKKKIRFKHSYVKIRVTSPDISSLCPCPDECVPGVKGGIFTDNEGIKVTVGRVTGTPSFSSKKSFYSDVNFKLYKTYFEPSYTILSTTNCISGQKFISTLSGYHYKYGNHYNVHKSKSETKVNRNNSYINDVIKNIIHSFDCIDIGSFISKNHPAFGNSQPFKENISKSISFQNFSITDTSNNTSFESIYLLNRNSSVSLVTLPDSISVISFSTTDSTSSSSFYELKQNFNDCEIVTNSLFELQNSKINLSTVESVRNNNNNNESFTCCSNKNFISLGNGYDICMFGIHKTNVRNSMKSKPSNNNKSNITVDKISNDLDIQQFLCRILSREQLYDTSSLIVVMSTSSDENNPRYGQSVISSTIALDVVEKSCSWNYKVHSLRHLHQNHGGFKITTTGRTLKNGVQSIMNNKHLEDPNIPYRKEEIQKKYIKEKKERKHITLKIKENCRIISTDTTQDRPCCCEVNDKLYVSSAVCQGRMDNIVTEIVTPIILKEADAQGLCHEAYKYSSRKNEICQQRVPDSHSNLGILTDHPYSVPCHLHSTQICDSANRLLNENTKNNAFKTCECDPQKIMELFDKKAKEMLSKACNISQDDLLEKSGLQKQIHRETPNFSKAQCKNCGLANWNEKIMSDKNKLCEKNVNSLCPCQQQKQQFSTEYHIEDQHNKNKKCKCKEHLRKNIICECPKEPDPEVDLSEWIDEKQIRKLKSELTQTRSGFKINKPRKKDEIEKSDLDMNFEELLKYIAENLEDESSKYNKDVCSCSENSGLKSRNVTTHCECPYEESPSQIETGQISEEEPFTGIKFHISGKGSGSKGLDGILCFELLNDLSKQNKI